VAVERKEQRWCARDEERFFFFSVQRPQSLFLCIFLPLTSPSLLLFLDDDGAVGGDWEERWRRWWRLCGPQPMVLPLLCFSVGFGFFCSFTLLAPSKFLGSFLSFTPKITPCSYLSLCPKTPLTLSFASLFLQKFAPLIAGSSSSIYKQRRRGLPYPCHGAG